MADGYGSKSSAVLLTTVEHGPVLYPGPPPEVVPRMSQHAPPTSKTLPLSRRVAVWLWRPWTMGFAIQLHVPFVPYVAACAQVTK